MRILQATMLPISMDTKILFLTIVTVCASIPLVSPIHIPPGSVQRERRISVNRETLFYKVVEESTRGTLVGNVAKDFSKLLPERQTQIFSDTLKLDLTITNWRDRAVQLFTLDSATGYLRVATPPDREIICPSVNAINMVKPTEPAENLETSLLFDTDVYAQNEQNYVRGTQGSDMPCVIDIKLAYRFREVSPDKEDKQLKILEDPGLLTVRIEIEDINDHAPTFPQSRLMLELGEVSAIQGTTSIELPTAFDPDSGRNGSVLYRLYESSQELRGSSQYGISHNTIPAPAATQQSSTFRLEGNPLRLVLTAALDWETTKEFNLIVFAQDNGVPKARVGQLNVHVTVRDENDNAPEFLQPEYSVVINESVLRGAIILELTAKDADSSSNGQLTFSMAQPLNAQEKIAMQYFGIRTIASNEAAIYVILTPDVDELRRQPTLNVGTVDDFADRVDGSGHASQQFVFHVVVRDNGYPRQLSSRAKITITVVDVNDMAPAIFVSYLNSPKSQDSGKSEYSLTPMPGERTRGIVAENVARAFVAFVTVQDYDSGPWGQVRCHTTNDDFALFPVGESSTDVTSSFNSEQFGLRNDVQTLQSGWGEIGFKLLAVKPFDREKMSEVTFYIVCVDNPTSTIPKYQEATSLFLSSTQRNYNPSSGYSSSTSQLTGTTLVRVMIADENDNAPQFSKSQYVFIIDESDGKTGRPITQGMGRFVGQVIATDADHSSHVTYTIAQALMESFSIEPDTGKIYIKRQVDREKIVETLQASDSDNVDGLKSKIEGDGNVYMTLPVTATDGRYNVTANVRLLIQDINDNPPVFTKSHYEFSIPENEQPAHSGCIGVIQARDNDIGQNAHIVYQLMDIRDSPSSGISNLSNFESHRTWIRSLFTISSKSGQLHLMRKLDREQQTHYIFYVLATDNPPEGRTQPAWKSPDSALALSAVSHTATATVTVIVEDVNDNAPKITYPPPHGIVNVESGAPAGHNLFTVVAEDPDAGENGTVRFGLHLATFEKSRSNTLLRNGNSTQPSLDMGTVNAKSNGGLFSIDPATGLVFVVEKLVDQSANYLLVIEAHDMGRPEQRKVTSTVTVRVQNSQLLNALAAFQAGVTNSKEQQAERNKVQAPRFLSNDRDAADPTSQRSRDSEQGRSIQTMRTKNEATSDGEPLFSPIYRNRLLPLTERTIVVILATIFGLLLLITVVLILLIKRRRDQEQQVSAQKDKYDFPRPNNNAVKVELLRSGGQSTSPPVNPNDEDTANVSAADFATLPRIRPIIIHEGQFVELDNNYTNNSANVNIYGDHLNSLQSQRVPEYPDVQRMSEAGQVQSTKPNFVPILDKMELKQIIIASDNQTNPPTQKQQCSEKSRKDNGEGKMCYVFEDNSCDNRQCGLNEETKNVVQSKGVSFV
ncbi:protocadherin-11 Y-linked [Clonorchis sinensis]|uniref:Protocadherin-11 Y-linked n=1 Tax=Clonorchis sinensis TaxID=79923 RepID=G7YH17_CLOSI|nr:protocadherin-11 Y-linked [Clonorchis sinensis]